MLHSLYKILCVFCLFHGSVSSAQISDSVKNYVDSSLSILKENSLYAKKLNWKNIEEQVYKKAAGAGTKAQTFEALKIAFTALGDKHAAYYMYDDQFRLPDSALLLRYTDSIKAAWLKGPRIVNRMIGRTAYLNIPFMGVNRQEDIDLYATRLFDTVVKLSRFSPGSWIIDLRLNSGGNIRPMLAGLALFFGDGIISSYIDRDGNATDEARFHRGNFQINGITQATVKNKEAAPTLKNARVAVLTGAGTASSGEGVAVVFQQRKKTMLFGEPTAGRANSTNGFVFNNQQSYFLISTAYLGDKNKKALPEIVRPDVAVKNNDAFNYLEEDVAVKAALRWLTR